MVPLSTTTDGSGIAPPQEKRPLSFAITLPTFAFSVAAFAEAWEYDEEDKDSMAGDGHEDLVDARRHALTSRRRFPAEVGRQRVGSAGEEGEHGVYWWSRCCWEGSQRDVKVRGC